MATTADIQQVRREKEKDDISLQGKGLEALFRSSHYAQEHPETWRRGSITWNTALQESLSWHNPGRECHSWRIMPRSGSFYQDSLQAITICHETWYCWDLDGLGTLKPSLQCSYSKQRTVCDSWGTSCRSAQLLKALKTLLNTKNKIQNQNLS